MASMRDGFNEYKKSIRSGTLKRNDYEINSQALLKEKEIFAALRNRISPHVPNGDIAYRLNEKFYEVYLVLNRRTIYVPELIMDFSTRCKLGNESKYYYIDIDFGELSHAADFFRVFNDFCNLRLYCIECNSQYHTKQTLQRFKNETLEKYPDCEFDTGRSHRH